MKLLFDENLSRKLPRRLADLFPDSRHVSDLGLKSCTDFAICENASAQGFVIVTQDEDFAELVHLFPPGLKVIWLTLGNTSTAHRERILRTYHEQIEAFAVDQERSLFVIE